MNKLSRQEMAYLASLGTLWGITEITLGMALHNMHVPFTGLIQTFIGTVAALTALKLTGRKRSLIYTAVIAAVLKMLSLTSVKIFPFIGILMSAVVGQCVICLLGAGILGLSAAGGVMCCWPFAQSLLFYLLAYSPEFLKIYQRFFVKIGLPGISVETIIVWIFIVHFLFGIFASAYARKLAAALKSRLCENE